MEFFAPPPRSAAARPLLWFLVLINLVGAAFAIMVRSG